MLPRLRESGNRYHMPDMLGARARAVAEQGADGREPADEALHIDRDSGDPLDLAFAAWGAAPVYLAAGESTRRPGAARRGRPQSHRSQPEYARMLPGLARAAVKVGDTTCPGA